jgi:hypothetical protein
VAPVSRDVPAHDPRPGNARADIDPADVFAALDRIVAETPLATRLRTEGGPATSTRLQRFDSMDSAGVFAALDKVVAETPVATKRRTEGAPAAPTRERFDSEEPQPVRSAPVRSAPVHPSVASGSVNEPRLLRDGLAEYAEPAEVVKQPIIAGANASAQFDLPQVPVQPRQRRPSLELGVAEVSGDPDLLIAPVAAAAPRRQTAFEPAFRLPESASQTGQDKRARLRPDRAPLENVNGAPDRTRSAVWPLGFALVLGVSLGFAGGYEVASWQRQPEAAREAAAAPAPAAEANSWSAVRGFTESAVHEPAAAATPGTPGTDASVTPTAAQPPAAARTAAAPPAAEGRLLIRSTPAGARVVLDGRDVGETPLTVRDVANGAHTVRVVRDGYVADQQRVIVSAARPAPSLTIALTRPAAAAALTPSGPGQSMAAVYVASRPAGASVFLDGKLIGTTPLQVGEVTAGNHTVGLELDGYQRWSSSVHVVAGERSRVAASLDR